MVNCIPGLTEDLVWYRYDRRISLWATGIGVGFLLCSLGPLACALSIALPNAFILPKTISLFEETGTLSGSSLALLAFEAAAFLMFAVIGLLFAVAGAIMALRSDRKIRTLKRFCA